MYTTSTALLEALHEAGVEYIFANLGSDHPGIVEALAAARAEGRPLPQLITVPTEMVAMSCAHGYAQITGRPQAVFVHVECGTQSLGGAVHNAAKGRVPVFVFAGSSPFTQEQELPGSRGEFIQWAQDVHDQRGIVRGYMRYDNEIRTGRNVKQLVARALQFACSDPQGPVYLMGAREVMEEEVAPVQLNAAHWQPLAPAALPPDYVTQIAEALVTARRPLIVTSYLGRDIEAAVELQALCERLAIGVFESVPSYMNFPADNPLHVGTQWNEPRQHPALAEADVILVLDSDVPWIARSNRPHPDATIFHIDVDPLKEAMPLWYIPAVAQFRASARVALQQLNAAVAACAAPAERLRERRTFFGELHRQHQQQLRAAEQRQDVLTPAVLTAAVRERLDQRSIVISEGVSNFKVIFDHIASTRPGSFLSSGGGSLGYHGGAAVGARLAAPDHTVVALCGDGTYLFSQPSTVHWLARRYAAPFLTVVYNNRGWRAPRLSALGLYPDGYASRASELGVSFDPPADYAGIAAAAGGALAVTVRSVAELDDALDRAFHAVRVEGRAAVVDAWLPDLMAERRATPPDSSSR